MKISYLHTEYNEVYDETHYYGNMEGNPMHYIISHADQTTTLEIYSPETHTYTIQGIFNFDADNPEKTIDQFFKLLIL